MYNYIQNNQRLMDRMSNQCMDRTMSHVCSRRRRRRRRNRERQTNKQTDGQTKDIQQTDRHRTDKQTSQLAKPASVASRDTHLASQPASANQPGSRHGFPTRAKKARKTFSAILLYSEPLAPVDGIHGFRSSIYIYISIN